MWTGAYLQGKKIRKQKFLSQIWVREMLKLVETITAVDIDTNSKEGSIEGAGKEISTEILE